MHKISTLTVKTDDRTIVSFDPGFRNLGWAVIKIENNTPYLRYHDTIVLPPDFLTKSEKDQRRKYDRFLPPEALLWLETRIDNVISKCNATDVAYERIFFGRNVTSVVGVIEVCSLLKTLSARHKALIYQYPPHAIKVAVTGNKTATKEQMETYVKKLIPNYQPTSDHDVDAVSTGICHCLSLRKPKV